MTANSSSSSAAGFFRIRSGTESFPMSCSRPPIASARRSKAKLFAHLHGAKGDAPRVLLGGLVLLGQALHEGVDPRAEEGLLFRDELGGAEVAHERARLD